jgi:tetraacyldisaccharide 4'-kinase
MSRLRMKDRILFFVMEHLGSRFVQLLGRTLDVEIIGREYLERARELSKTGTWMFAVFHGRMFVPVYHQRDQGITALVSRSKDGEGVARLVQRLGYRTVRGSTAKGGAEGMLTMIRTARSSVVANMIDGPTGPREEPKIGTIAISRTAKVPIVPIIGSAAPSREFDRSWDRFQLPSPFARAVLGYGEPIIINPDHKSEEELEQDRLELKRRMIELREQVDTRVWQRAMERRFSVFSIPSTIYSNVMKLRNRLFDTGVRQIVPSPVPVVSVGNLTAGGSGKSPLVREVVARLQRRVGETDVAVVSRGYRRKSTGLRVVADKQGVRLSPEDGGDEPVMLAKLLPGVPVVVAERRPEAIQVAAQRYGARVVVLDDGFQHRAASRSLDIVLLDASTPPTHWQVLPAGRMREDFSALKRAGLVVVTGSAAEGIVAGLIERIRRHTDAPVLRGGMTPVGLRPLGDGKPLPLEWLRDRKVAVAAAIARPRRFYDSVESSGAKLVSVSGWPDHDEIGRDRVQKLMSRAERRGAEAIVITAKDAVKWPVDVTITVPVHVLETEWTWQSGEEQLDSWLNRLSGEHNS